LKATIYQHKFLDLTLTNSANGGNSLEHLNDESLFGSLKTDQNLIEEGNIVLGFDLDNTTNNHEDELFFH